MSRFDDVDVDVDVDVDGKQCEEEQHQCGGAGDALRDIDKTNLIVNYIPQSSTVDELTQLFKKAGELESVKIMKHPRTGYSYGYGFVKFSNEAAAARAISMFNRFPYKNKTLKVSYSRPANQVTKNANLYISNLPKNFTDEQLGILFGKYGEIIQQRHLKDRETGCPRGVAFVRYARYDDAQRAIVALNGTQLPHARFPLHVRIADDHSQRYACLYDFAREPGGVGGAILDQQQRGGGYMLPLHIARSFSQLSLRSHHHHHHHHHPPPPPPPPPPHPMFNRYLGGGGDFHSFANGNLPW